MDETGCALGCVLEHRLRIACEYRVVGRDAVNCGALTTHAHKTLTRLHALARVHTGTANAPAGRR